MAQQLPLEELVKKGEGQTLEFKRSLSLQHKGLKAVLERLGERYDWGHITKDKYLAEYDEIQKQLRQLAPEEDKVKNLDKFAHFLAHVANAWKEGT